jgi:hypothetical protein
MAANDDEWIAAVGSYVRTSFGNRGGFITPADVARVRAATSDRKTSWTIQELAASLPTPLVTDGWKVTSSHASDTAIGALSLTGWHTGAPQQAGMWFQIEMPGPQTMTEIQFQSPSPSTTFRQGRTGGAAIASNGSPANTAETLGYPRGFKIDVSMDGTTWKTVAEGVATGSNTTMTFPPARGSRLRISLTSTVANSPAWSMQNLQVLALGPK